MADFFTQVFSLDISNVGVVKRLLYGVNMTYSQLFEHLLH